MIYTKSSCNDLHQIIPGWSATRILQREVCIENSASAELSKLSELSEVEVSEISEVSEVSKVSEVSDAQKMDWRAKNSSTPENEPTREKSTDA